MDYSELHFSILRLKQIIIRWLSCIKYKTASY